jgi:hypothetical protein
LNKSDTVVERQSSMLYAGQLAHHQSHFIRDFKALAGSAPGEHLLKRGELTRLASLFLFYFAVPKLVTTASELWLVRMP